MAFNHYAKIKRILNSYQPGWYVVKISEPTSAKNFKGETLTYSHYYRVYDNQDNPIKYCKFQQLDRFAQAVSIPLEEIPLVET